VTVTLFVPCFIDQIYPNVALAMVRILEQLGHTVRVDERITCCGQPGFNTGYWDEARAVAGPVVERLHNQEAVVIASGSCGAMLKVFYPELFANQPLEAKARQLASRTWEFSQFLVDKLGVTDLGARFEAKVTFHDGCHGYRELGIKHQPRVLLSHVRGLQLVELADPEGCCGFGGTFSAKFPAISTAMGEVKCNSALETGADYLVSSDGSCMMHLQGLLSRQEKPICTIHLAEVLTSR
jgi:L-lactate dehydrogenase complex protein LldE